MSVRREFVAVSGGVEDKVERDAAPALLKQQATAAPATDNTTQHAVQHVLTYPSRLIYYLNEDSESTYHDLDTRMKHQATEGQVSQRRRDVWRSHCGCSQYTVARVSGPVCVKSVNLNLINDFISFHLDRSNK